MSYFEKNPRFHSKVLITIQTASVEKTTSSFQIIYGIWGISKTEEYNHINHFRKYK